MRDNLLEKTIHMAGKTQKKNFDKSFYKKFQEFAVSRFQKKEKYTNAL